MRMGNLQYEEINVIIANADSSKKMPQSNQYLVQNCIKELVNRHEFIDNMTHPPR